jgi:hypothetical protein
VRPTRPGAAVGTECQSRLDAGVELRERSAADAAEKKRKALKGQTVRTENRLTEATLPQALELPDAAGVPALVQARQVPKRRLEPALLRARTSRLRRSTSRLTAPGLRPLPARKRDGAALPARPSSHRIRRSSPLLRARPMASRRPPLFCGDVLRVLPLLPRQERVRVARPQPRHGAAAMEPPEGQSLVHASRAPTAL